MLRPRHLLKLLPILAHEPGHRLDALGEVRVRRGQGEGRGLSGCRGFESGVGRWRPLGGVVVRGGRAVALALRPGVGRPPARLVRPDARARSSRVGSRRLLRGESLGGRGDLVDVDAFVPLMFLGDAEVHQRVPLVGAELGPPVHRALRVFQVALLRAAEVLAVRVSVAPLVPFAHLGALRRLELLRLPPSLTLLRGLHNLTPKGVVQVTTRVLHPMKQSTTVEPGNNEIYYSRAWRVWERTGKLPWL